MITNRKNRVILRSGLIYASIFLGIILFIMFIFWLLVVRQNEIDYAKKINHYYSYDINNLPIIEDKILADYIGKDLHKANLDHQVQTTEFKIKELAHPINQEEPILEDDDEDKDGGIIQPQIIDEDVVARANALLAETDNILVKNNNQHSPIAERDTTTKAIYVNSKPEEPHQPTISIIITNLGLNKKSTELALNLPKECALGFLPYTKSLKPLMYRAQSNGHEIYLYVPMQMKSDDENPGKYALYQHLSEEENQKRLEIILNSHSSYNGIYTSHREGFMNNKANAEIVLEKVALKNLTFILGMKEETMPAHLINNKNVLGTNIIIDKKLDETYINKQLEKLISLAQTKGHAIGYGQAYPLSIDLINKWLKTLAQKGVKLIPVSKMRQRIKDID